MYVCVTGHGIVPLAVPAEAAGSCILQTLVNCSSVDDCSLQSNSELRLVGSVRDIIIRPARKSYRPGQSGKTTLHCTVLENKQINRYRTDQCVKLPKSVEIQGLFHDGENEETTV
jgi:hypothetical protein